MNRLLRAYRTVGVSGIASLAAAKGLRQLARVASGASAKLAQKGNVLSAEDRALLAPNLAFRGRHKGQRCFVIGNGPSLQRQDLSHLATETTFVMNAFWKHPITSQWNPSYYCIADPVYFDGSDGMAKFFRDLRSAVRETRYFLPLRSRDHVLQEGLLPDAAASYVAFRGSLWDSVPEMPDFTQHVPGVQSVSQLAIMAAMYTGCTKIYLLGMDHDWLAQRGMDRHFYEGITIENHEHAHGDLDRTSYSRDVEDVLKLFRGYEHLRDRASLSGIEIINASRGGFLDVFPRVEYESLFPARAASNAGA